MILATLSVLVGVFLYSEFEKMTSEKMKDIEEKKFIETGTLINLVYEADGFSRIALLTGDDSDFEHYMERTDSLFLKLKEIKSLTTNSFQLQQLDTVKALLIEKNQNIEQLRILRLTNKKDTSLDEIMVEVRKLEASIGVITIEGLFKNPKKLSRRERRIWQSYADYLNSDSARDSSVVKSKTVDSMLAASRYIVSEAKKKNSRIRESLRIKEDELIRNELNISERLRQIIESFDAEVTRKNNLERIARTASIKHTGEVLKYAGILGVGLIFIFTYFILSDFFKAEQFKRNLQESKNYAEKLLKSREQLISTVSHDLKTPLNTITGYSELLDNSPLSEKQKNYLTQINSSSLFISQLVDDLLDYSKLEAGKLTVENIPFSLENIVKEAGNAVKQLYMEKPVDLKISISEEIRNHIFEGDPLRIRQIINNLVGNAFKFTNSGLVEIVVRELEKKELISTIEIAVIDSGIGISIEKQVLIFNEFTQAEIDTGKKFGGSGLGLAISKKLAELLNGKIVVKSVLGEGSSFIFTVPLINSERTLIQKKSPTNSSFLGLKGVIIDDDDALRSLLTEFFQQLEIDTRAFSGFNEFINSHSDFQFHFILTDIQMPGKDGFSVLRILKSGKVDRYNHQPVIAMTGNREFSRENLLKLGFTEFIPKPFSKNDLIMALENVFPGKINTSSTKRENTPNEVIKKSQPTKRASELYDLSLLRSFLNSQQALDEVLTIFNDQTKRDLLQLEEAVDLNNLTVIQEVAHRMLTMFRQLQTKKPVKILEKMERYALNGIDEREMIEDLKQFSHSAKELLEALKEEYHYSSIL